MQADTAEGLGPASYPLVRCVAGHPEPLFPHLHSENFMCFIDTVSYKTQQ